MTNCQNCGAPYKPGIPVCEYCGTPREWLDADISAATNNAVERDRVTRELRELEQKNRELQFNFEQMRLNAEQARVSDMELRQTVALQQRMQAVRSDIMRQKHSEEQFYSHLLCFVILTFLLPSAIPICLILSIKTAIVAKLLGMVLIPTWFCLGYIIILRGMKRYKGGRR